VIRPFGLRDISWVRELQPEGTAFDVAYWLFHPFSPAFSACLGYFWRHRPTVMTSVFCQERAECGDGFVQIRTGKHPDEWELSFLAPALTESEQNKRIWLDLLAHLVVFGALCGVRRIYARVREDPMNEHVLREAGFSVVTREEIFVLKRPLDPVPAPAGLREVRDSDRRRLDEFVQQVVPPLVYKANGTNSRCSFLPHPLLALFLPKREFVWDERGRILAYFSSCTFQGVQWIEAVVRPEVRGDVGPCIHHVVANRGRSAEVEAYVRVQEYCKGLGWVLRTLDFEPWARQVVMVAHTTANALVSSTMTLKHLQGCVEARPHPSASKTIASQERKWL